MPAEVELKLGIDVAALSRLLRHPALAAVRSGRATRRRLVARYFDTPDGQLADAGIGLRLRHEQRGWVQAVKGPALATSSGALTARDEHECAVPGPQLDPAALAATPWSRALARALADPAFGPRFGADFERTTIPLRLGAATTALLCVDRGELATVDGERRCPIAEVEIELQAGDPVELFALAAALAADLPLRTQVASKAERGIALVRHAPDGWLRPVRAAAPAIDAHGDAALAFAAIVRSCVDQIAANAAGLLADDDPEWVHQMRVGTRRLRSCLSLLGALLPAPGVAAVGAELRWLATALGRCRDLDVYIDTVLLPLRQAVAPDSATAAALSALHTAARHARAGCLGDARAAVDSARFTRVILAAGALGAAERFGLPAGAGDALALPVAQFAAALLDRRYARVKRRATLLAHGSDEERHAVRIAAKKLRYSGEFFAPAFGHRRRARSFAARLAALQDVLGELNDGVSALRLTASLADGAAVDSAAAGAVAGWVAARKRQNEHELATAWSELRRAPRFWRAD